MISVKKSGTRYIKILLIIVIISISIPAALADGFTDVNEGDTHYLAISELKSRGIIEGYENNTFKAKQKVSRAEGFKILLLASDTVNKEEIENSNTVEVPFNDTPLIAWYTKYLALGKEKGIISGYKDGSFQPNESINLAETLKIFLETTKKTNIQTLEYQNAADFIFDDTPVNEWYTPYTMYAASLGLLNINSNNTVDPNQKMTRGYISEIIYRWLLEKEGFFFGKATWYGGKAQGKGTASGQTFDYNDLTAAHKTLPFDTIIQVTNLANGKSIEVKINDRGPYGPGRVLDLSSGAFSEIATLGSGIINVQYKVVQLP